MRLVQFVAPAGQRRVGRVSDDGQMVEALRGVASVYGLARSAIAGGQRRASLADAPPRGRAASDLAGPSPGPAAGAGRPSRSGALHVTGTGLTHLGSAATRDAMHKDSRRRRTSSPNSMKMFRMGLEGGKPGAGESACSPNGSTRATARMRRRPRAQPLRQPGLRARRRRGAGDRRHLPDRRPTARRAASASRSATSSPTTSPSGRTTSASPTPSCAPAPSGRSCCWARCPTTSTAPAAIRRGGEVALGEAVPLGRGQHVATPSPTSSTTTSSTRLFRRPGDVHVHYVRHRRRSPSPTASGPSPATSSRSRSRRFGLPLRNPLSRAADEGLARVAAL